MAKKQSDKPSTKFVDIPELRETFADSVETAFGDAATLRITFAVNRWDEPKPPKPLTGRRCPVCRLVLTHETAVELYNRLHQMITMLEKKGLVKREQGGSPTIQ